MAEVGEGPWFNKLTGEYETVTGVWCSCYECRMCCDGFTENWEGATFYTKKQYRVHQNERRQSYLDWKRQKATKDGKARTKEKREAQLVWEGQPCRPTFFDIINGTWTEEESLVHLWDRVYEDPSDYL